MYCIDYLLVVLFLSMALIMHSTDADETVEQWSVDCFDYLPLRPRRFSIRIFSPTTPGSYPVLVFVTGLAGVAPSFPYSGLFTNIAKQKVIVIAISKIELITPENVATSIEVFLDWLVVSSGARQLFADHKEVNGVTPDVNNRLGLMGHSQGGQSITAYLDKMCGYIKVLILISPVDALFGIPVGGTATDPPHRVPFKIPTLIITGGLGMNHNAVKAPLLVPCAPSQFSNDRFYQAMCGPVFLINITNMGHTDYLDSPAAELNICAQCTGGLFGVLLNIANSEKVWCNRTLIRSEMATIITTFTQGIFDKNSAAINIIKNAAASFKGPITVKYDLHGYNYDSDSPGGFCTHQQFTDDCQVVS